MISACLLIGLISRTPILTYHDIILRRTKKSVWFDCTVQEFRDQIAWLKNRGAVFVSTSDISRRLAAQKPLPKNAVCITFADNYFGFYKYAWPILKKERIPVIQFVHTGFVGSKAGRKKMSWAQLRELDQTGLVTIGSQTVTHPEDLTKMTSAQILKEFVASKQQIESKLGHAISHLAYPNGKFDFRVSTLARQAGYASAFTEACKLAEERRNQFEIPRYVHTKYREAWASSQKQSK